MTTNRVMRFFKNPNARGFVVRVMEEESRCAITGTIIFKILATRTAGTRVVADRHYDELREEFIRSREKGND